MPYFLSSTTIAHLFTSALLSLCLASAAQAGDFDGDGREDLTTFNPTSGQFTNRQSSNLNFSQVSVGSLGNVPATGDFNGDGKTDFASFNRATGVWTLNINGDESTQSMSSLGVGGKVGLIPIPAIWNGNSCTDYGVFNPVFSASSAKLTIKDCISGEERSLELGTPGTIPVIANYDGDNRDDYALFDMRTGIWQILRSSDASLQEISFGLPGDIPFAGDFNGDGKANLIVHRALASGSVFIVRVGDQDLVFPWGLLGDRPSIMDVGGDRKIDFSVFRPESGGFFLSTSELAQFNDIRMQNFSFAAASVPLGLESIYPATPADFNRDRKTEIIRVQTGGSVNIWNALLLDSSRNLIQFAFGLPTDQLLLGDLDGDLKVEPVVVRDGGNGLLVWFIQQADGGILQINFGFPEDVPHLGDLDCDGRDDLVVARKLNGGLQWFWLLSSQNFQGSVFSRAFGLENDFSFLADMNGDGCQDFAVAQQQGTAFTWFHFSPKTFETGSASWGLVDTDTPMQPTDFDGDRKADPVVVREQNGSRTGFVGTSEGISVSLGSSGAICAGNYSGVNKAEFAVYQDGNAAGQDTVTVIRYDGQVQVFSLPQSPGEGDLVGASCLASASNTPVQCDSFINFNDGRGGSLYKPFSDGEPGRAVVLLNKVFFSLVNGLIVFDSEGNPVAGEQRRKCCPNGDRAHWWLNKKSVSLPKNIIIQFVLRDGSTLCGEVPDPTQRYD